MIPIIEKECIICKKKRRFLVGSEREQESICGECWDWETKSLNSLKLRVVKK